MLTPPEPLAKLLNELKVLPRVVDAKAFKVVDPAQLAAAGCDEAVRIFLELDTVTEARLDQYDDSIFDRHGFLVPNIGYMSEEAHEHIINNAKEYLNNIK
jgi:hypothetical protein